MSMCALFIYVRADIDECVPPATTYYVSLTYENEVASEPRTILTTGPSPDIIHHFAHHSTNTTHSNIQVMPTTPYPPAPPLPSLKIQAYLNE